MASVARDLGEDLTAEPLVELNVLTSICVVGSLYVYIFQIK